MWRSKKFILAGLLATVVLFGSIGGVVLAADNGEDSQPEARYETLLDRVCEIYEENTGVAINSEALKDAFAQARGEMQVEHPKGRLQNGPMAQVFESFGVDQEAVQSAFEQARTELEGGTLEGGRAAVMVRVLEILGIDEEDWQAACAEVRQAHQFGFRGHRGFHGMNGMRGFGGPCAPSAPTDESSQETI